MAKKEIDDKEFFKQLEEKLNVFFTPDRYKTGIIPLDLALNGALETGSLIELSGESQTGKSTLLMNLSRVMCEQGEKVVYIDAEGSVKEDLINGIGLTPYLATQNNPDNSFTLVKKSTYNEVEEAISLFLKRGGYKLFIIDSITALIGDVYTDLSEDRNSTEARVGFDAQMIGRLLKKLNSLKVEHNCIFIFINQTRVDMSNPYLTKMDSTGGQAVKFYPDVRLFMKRKTLLKNKTMLITGEHEIPTGAETTIEARKSRLGLGNIPYPMTVNFGKGINNLLAAIDLLKNIDTTVDGKETKMLYPETKVTYTLNLPSGTYKTTKGSDGVNELVKEHFQECMEVINEYLDNFYNSLKYKGLSYDESSTKVIENKQKDYSLDDNLDLPEVDSDEENN